MKQRIFIFIALSIISMSLSAQTEDFGFWSTVGAEKNLGKWNASVDAELRTKDNASLVDRWSLRLESSYKILRKVEAGAGYQLIYFNDTKYMDYQLRHRAYLFLQGKYKYGDFSFSLRERLQLTTKDETDRIKESGKIDTYNVDPDVTWRNKLKLSYDIPGIPVNPSIAIESFYQLNNPDGNAFEKQRYTLLLSYKLKKQHQFEIYGLIDNEINTTDPVRQYITGIGYIYSF